MAASNRFSATALVALAAGTLGLSAVAVAQAAAIDPAAIWTAQWENASISSGAITDRLYTNGLRLGWTSPTDDVPVAVRSLGQSLYGDGQQRLTFGLLQQIYTPVATQLRVPPPTDRPYAAILMGSVGLVQDSANVRNQIVVGLGMIGPAALGGPVQNGFHDVIGQGHNLGWPHQIANEPLAELTASRTWRLPLGQAGQWETDALPNLTVGFGNLRLYGQGGMTMRLGQGLNTDFGVARVLPGMSGGDAYLPADFAWYVFLGADGQAVARDITLDGSDMVAGPSVAHKPWLGEAQAGFAVMGYGMRLSYTHIVQTQQFQRQKGGLHQLGSLALSAKF